MSESMNVTVYGPNLPKALADLGTLHVHKTGCADTKRGAFKTITDKDEWGFDATSVHAIVTNCYPPDDFQYDDSDPDEYRVFRSDVHVAPCVTLPEELPAPSGGKCTWDGHDAAIAEAGDCPVCGVGDYDPEFAARNLDTSLDEDGPDPLDTISARVDKIVNGHPDEAVHVPSKAERRAAKREARQQQRATKTGRTSAGNTNPKGTKMSTKSALKDAGIDPKLAKMGVEDLRAEAARLNIEGRSKLTKRADLEKAIVKAKAAKKSSPKAKASGNGGTPVASHGDLKPGAKVRVVRTVDLSTRTEGFAGVVEVGTEGTVKELRQSGPGVQVVFDVKDVGSIAMGARHFEVV